MEKAPDARAKARVRKHKLLSLDHAIGRHVNGQRSGFLPVEDLPYTEPLVLIRARHSEPKFIPLLPVNSIESGCWTTPARRLGHDMCGEVFFKLENLKTSLAIKVGAVFPLEMLLDIPYPREDQPAASVVLNRILYPKRASKFYIRVWLLTRLLSWWQALFFAIAVVIMLVGSVR